MKLSSSDSIEEIRVAYEWTIGQLKKKYKRDLARIARAVWFDEKNLGAVTVKQLCDGIVELHDAYDSANGRAEAAEAVLRSLEHHDQGRCPFCGGFPHAEWCNLSKAIGGWNESK